MNSKSVKINQFKKSIRKTQISQIFQQERCRLKAQQIQIYTQALRDQLSSIEKRRVWIMQKKSQLKGIPNQNWKNCIMTLISAVPYFENDFSSWTNGEILKHIFLVLKSQKDQFNLAPVSARLLNNILISDAQFQTVQKQIVSSKILSYIPEKINQTQYNLEDCSYFLSIIFNINLEDRLLCLNLKQKSIQLFAKRVISENCQQKSIIRVFYSSMLAFATNLQQEKYHKNICKPNQLLLTVHKLFQLFGLKQGDQALLLLIETAETLLKSPNQNMHKMFMKLQGTLKSIISSLLVPCSEVRQKAADFLALYTSSTEGTIGRQLMNLKLFQQLRKSIEFSQNKPLFDKIMKRILMCIGNIVSDEDFIIIDYLCKHQLMAIIVNYCGFQKPKNINSQSIYCLNSFLIYGGFQVSYQLEEKYRITDILAMNFKQIPKDITNIKDIKQIMNCIKNHIKNCSNVSDYKKKIINNLQSNYQYSKLIQSIWQSLPSTINLEAQIEENNKLLETETEL